MDGLGFSLSFSLGKQEGHFRGGHADGLNLLVLLCSAYTGEYLDFGLSEYHALIFQRDVHTAMDGSSKCSQLLLTCGHS